MAADRRRRRTLLAVLVLVSLMLVTLDFRQGDDGPLGAVQRGAMAVFSPVQDVVGGILRPIGGFFSSIGELGTLREENAALERELEALRARNVALADLERENAQLRDLVRMDRQLDFTTSAGRVIAQPPGAFRWSVLIDIGSEHGVARDMAVVNPEGFVGKVTDVTTSHARVQLAASPNAGYSVRVADTGQQGLISGRGSRPMEMFILDEPETVIPEGAEVVTRAFQGGSIPDGIPIGAVERRGDDGTERAQFLDIRPHVDFSRLDVVLVVLDAPVMPVDLEPEEAEDEDLPDGLDETETPDGADTDGEDVGVAPAERWRRVAAGRPAPGPET
jgi:rod shape-determining protein MreC